MVALDGSVLVVDDTPSKRYVLASWLRLEQFASRLLEEIGPTTVDDDVATVVVRRTA